MRKKLSKIIPILKCPKCNSGFLEKGEEIICEKCNYKLPMIGDDILVFLSEKEVRNFFNEASQYKPGTNPNLLAYNYKLEKNPTLLRTINKDDTKLLNEPEKVLSLFPFEKSNGKGKTYQD